MILKKKKPDNKTIAFYSKIFKTKALFFFIGKNIKREIILYDRNILKTNSITLVKANNVILKKILNKNKKLSLFTNLFFSYNLIGITNKLWSEEELFIINNLLYKNIVFTKVVLNNGSIYNTNMLHVGKTAQKLFSKLIFLLTQQILFIVRSTTRTLQFFVAKNQFYLKQRKFLLFKFYEPAKTTIYLIFFVGCSRKR